MKAYKFAPLVEKMDDLRREIIRGIFDEVICPALTRYNWSMDWAMGSVSFFNEKGQEIRCETSGDNGVDGGSTTLKHLVKEINDIFDELPCFGKGGSDGYTLWWIMSGIKFDGRYTVKEGFQPYDKAS
jgi:hypothetical protein